MRFVLHHSVPFRSVLFIIPSYRFFFFFVNLISINYYKLINMDATLEWTNPQQIRWKKKKTTINSLLPQRIFGCVLRFCSKHELFNIVQQNITCQWILTRVRCRQIYVKTHCQRILFSFELKIFIFSKAKPSWPIRTQFSTIPMSNVAGDR